MSSLIRQQAKARLSEVHAQLYVLDQQRKALENEARTIVGFINFAEHEDKELAQTKAAETIGESRE